MFGKRFSIRSEFQETISLLLAEHTKMFSKHIKASNNNDNSNASVSFSYVSSIRAVKVSFPGETAAAAPLQSSATVKQKQLRKRSKVYHMLLDAHCSEAQLTVTSLQRRRQQGTGG